MKGQEMKRASSQPLLKHFRESDDEYDDEDKAGRHKSSGEELFSWGKYGGAWTRRQEQRSAAAARLKKQLKARFAIQKLIDEQLTRFRSNYIIRALGPRKLSHISQLLMPNSCPSHQLAAMSWLGDWRPSTILELLHSLTNSLSDPPVGVERALSQLINDIRIEEAIIDEEMTEIQATCVLHLPIGPVTDARRTALARVRSEFKKIYRVMSKAQCLRLKTLELIVRKILNQTDAAEFLIAYAGLEDMIHAVAMKF